MIELRAVPGRTGRMLLSILRESGLHVNDRSGPTEGIVSYGVPVREGDVPVLNGNAGRRNKLAELECLREKGVSVPAFARADGNYPTVGFPMLGRRVKHVKGRDIVICRNVHDARVAGRDFFTHLIEKRREYRVWAYRRKAIATYEKLKRYAPRGRRGRATPTEVWNWGRGYAFEFYHDAPQELKDLGAAAINALGLDFGAVDVIEDMNGKLYVLEVNTAPGVLERRQGISVLANKISRWAVGGFKKRKEV